MDISERTSNIIRLINRKKNGELVEPELIRCVCEYYDYMRLHQISTASLHFLRYISKEAGVPQYYYMLERFETNIEPSDIDINTMSILIYESTLHTDETVMLHRYQMEVLNRFRDVL